MIERYWGKADVNYAGEPKWHPLVCLRWAESHLVSLYVWSINRTML